MVILDDGNEAGDSLLFGCFDWTSTFLWYLFAFVTKYFVSVHLLRNVFKLYIFLTIGNFGDDAGVGSLLTETIHKQLEMNLLLESSW